MVEHLDSMGRRIPQEIEVIPRQFVVAIGKAARRILKDQFGLEPSQELITSYVQKLKPATAEHQFLRDEANRTILAEHEIACKLLITEGNSPREARRLANQQIKERYERFDKDRERNFSYLDDILITE